MRRHFLVNILEHGSRIERGPLCQGSVAGRMPPTGGDLLLQLLFECCMPLFGPFTQRYEMLLQPDDGIPKRPCFPLFLRPVPRRIVARGMSGRPVSNQLDEGRSTALARALGGPLCNCINRQEVVAIDPDTGDAVTRTALGERLELSASKPLEGGDRPLVVDHV